MSSKLVDPNPAGAGTPTLQSWSISGRLTVFYTVSACIILVLSTGFLYWVLASSLRNENNQFLADKIHVLRKIMRERSTDPEAFVEETQWEGAARRFTRYYARLLDAGGRTLIETPGMREILTASVFPAPVGVLDEPAEGLQRRLPHGESYLLMAAWAVPGHAADAPRLLQVALDISHDEALLADYRRMLVMALFVGIVCSAGIGAAITHKGLRPLTAITTAARHITAAHLHERIAPTRWPQELTALATAFDAMLDRLEEAFTRLSQFSADLAHELRTPINNLMGEAEVTLARSRTPDEYQQILESSLEEYARLSQMIEGLLFLARAENPHTHIEASPVDAGKALEAVREFYEAVAVENGVEVVCQGQAFVYAEPLLFRRAVSNLLANALQYTPHGGTITLDVKQTSDQAIVVRIRDTGCGIAPEHLPKLFDRFYRVDPARSYHPGRSGLGLAIVKSIMDLHGGTITIRSTLTTGTTVHLKFPSPAAATT